MKLKAPFPYQGGKKWVASEVWRRFGDVEGYIEPFCGSAAMLLGAPKIHRYELLNDKDCLLVNLWRAIKHDPKGLIRWADYPTVEKDLHARHQYLVDNRAQICDQMDDPEFYDLKFAGWWVWGQSISIANWCGYTEGDVVNKSKPYTNGAMRRGVRQRAMDWHLLIKRLSRRLEDVIVYSGDWERCVTKAMVRPMGIQKTAVFLDPPYKESNMDYAAGGVGAGIADDAEAWCLEWSGVPEVRIAICGHDGDYPELDKAGWEKYVWKRKKGHAKTKRAKELAARDTIWFSPSCLSGELQHNLPNVQRRTPDRLYNGIKV